VLLIGRRFTKMETSGKSKRWKLTSITMVLNIDDNEEEARVVKRLSDQTFKLSCIIAL